MRFVFDGIFPNPHEADPDGLLAVGGDLEPQTLINAYSIGAFPWYNEEDPILWWCPDPRLVLFPSEVKVSKSMKQLLKKGVFSYSLNQKFEEVIDNCRQIRIAQEGTWISPEIVDAYTRMHHLGLAHSVEVWQEDVLVGGFYGLQLGRVFYGESMFSKVSNASKAALIYFCLHAMQEGIEVIDCQQSTNHLISLGAREISRYDFLELLDTYL
ncbi:MAG: leucyl/phenylalanyl-tRNA--protein transferase [Bacteroidia bacterium]|jgi:leucyl/phenylalanyl-tRNA--protein transferase|nr:leucyl/phenylalanyl-tRNA--protein transferase [Bacteroidia bacterium]